MLNCLHLGPRIKKLDHNVQLEQLRVARFDFLQQLFLPQKLLQRKSLVIQDVIYGRGK